jgi:acetylornithine deacetylase
LRCRHDLGPTKISKGEHQVSFSNSISKGSKPAASAGEDDLLSATIAILGELISFPSVSSVSNRNVTEYICRYMTELGAKVERISSTQGDKENLWITFGEGTTDGLVLAGHVDVVPVAGQQWSRPPFELTREGSKLYGRGTTDMKGFVACAMAVAALLQGQALRYPIHIAITFDEEVGCVGAKKLVEFLEASAVHPKAFFVGEPTRMTVVDRHKGSVGFTTEIVGKAAHSSQVHLGQSAIQIASELIGQLTLLAEQQTSREADHSFSYAYPSVNVGVIRGGHVRNVVAANCALDWEIRPILPQQLVDMREEFDSHVTEKLERYKTTGVHVPSITTQLAYDTPPLVADADSEASALAKRFTGQTETLAVSYGTEAGLYQEAGFATVVCGPGDIQQAHTADEWIEIGQLSHCLDFMRQLADYAVEGH